VKGKKGGDGGRRGGIEERTRGEGKEQGRKEGRRGGTGGIGEGRERGVEGVGKEVKGCTG